MSGGLCAGSGARLTALATQIDNSVLPAVREVPWKVTALPAAYQVADQTNGSPTIVWGILQQMHCAEVALAVNTTLQTLVSVSGSGYLEVAAVGGVGFSGTVRLVISIDGVDLLDATGASTAVNRVLYGCGSLRYSIDGGIVFEGWRIPFRSALTLKAAMSNASIAAKLWSRYTLAEPYTV